MPETIKKPRKPRRNFAREIERLTAYLEIMIRVKSLASPFVKGQVKAYRDCLDFMKEVANGGK